MKLHRVMTMNNTPVLVSFIARHIIYKLLGVSRFYMELFFADSFVFKLIRIPIFLLSLLLRFSRVFRVNSHLFMIVCACITLLMMCAIVEVRLMHHIIRSMVKVIPEYVFSSFHYTSVLVYVITCMMSSNIPCSMFSTLRCR